MVCGRRLGQQLISSRPLQATTQQQQCKRSAAPCCRRIGMIRTTSSVPPPPPAASSNSSSSSSGSSVVAEPAAAVDKGADKATAAAAGAEATAAGRTAVSGRSEWRPSEAHKASATSVARKQAQSARLKAGVAPRVGATGASTSEIEKARSPGLRRRELLGGAEDVPSEVKIAAASASAPMQAAAGTAASAGEASSGSVVSLSATTRFRARRELERLAAAGNAEAIEALRASETSPTSFLSSQAKAAGGTGQSGGGGGLTPLTVLPVLLALVGAGYCVVNDLVPQEWLSWISGGADSSGDSASARTESRNVQEEGGEASPLSPLLRTISRATGFVPANSSTATAAVPAPTDENASGDVGTKVGSTETAETEAGEAGQEGGGGWGLRRWWRNGASGGVPAGDVDGGCEETDSDFVSTEPAGGRGGVVESLRQDEASEQQQQPRWLARWRAPPPPAQSGSS